MKRTASSLWNRIIVVLALAVAEQAQAGPLPAAADQTYINLGDAVAFGVTTVQNFVPSFADQGYVSLFADFLATRNGGVRSRVVNLGTPGETSSSFFTGGQPFTTFNLNYPTPTPSQNSLFLTTVASEQAAGREVGVVTIHLGVNDLLNLSITPGFFAQPAAQRNAQVQQTLDTVEQNYRTLLTELRGSLPDADLLLLGFYNPYPVLPGLPPVVTDFAVQSITAFNDVVSGLAADFGGSYVDIYTPFLGHEADYTYILQPNTSIDPPRNNVHPTALGYEVIAAQLEAAAVPEPGSMMLIVCGLIVLVGGAGRRRSIRRLHFSD